MSVENQKMNSTERLVIVVLVSFFLLFIATCSIFFRFLYSNYLSDSQDTVKAAIDQQEPQKESVPDRQKIPHKETASDRQKESTPVAVKNLVIIRSPELPDQDIYGIYFKQKNGRSYFAGMPSHKIRKKQYGKSENSFNPNHAKFRIEFHPGQSDQRILEARYLSSGIPPKYPVYYFETTENIPPPEKINWSQANHKKNKTAIIYSFQRSEKSSASESIKIVKSVCDRTPNRYPQIINVDKQLPGGALVCDSKGVPYAILKADGIPYIKNFKQLQMLQRSSKFRDTYKATIRGVVYLSSLEKDSFEPEASGLIESLDLDVDRYTFRTTVNVKDLLQVVEAVEFYVGTLSTLKTDLDFEKHDRFDEPATHDMRIAQSEIIEQDRSSQIKRYYNVFAGPIKDGQPRHFVVQMRVLMKDGTSYFQKPRFKKGIKIDPARRKATSFTHYTPIVNETEEPLISRNSGKPKKTNAYRLKLPSLSTQKTRYPDSILNEVVWSPDGKYAYVMSRFGRLHMIRLSDRTQVRSVDLLTWCNDFDLSRAGLVIFSQNTLWVLDPETLQTRQKISVPRATFFGTGADSDSAYVIVNEHILHVDLKTGQSRQITIENTKGITIPDKRFTGIEMTEDGQTIVLSDASRIHRCQPRTDHALLYQESTVPLGEGKRMKFQQGDRRVALIIPPSTQFRLPGFPVGTNMVFSVDNLTKPLASISEDAIFLPFSGGMLDLNTDYEIGLLREDGSRVEVLKKGGNPKVGSANPSSDRVFLVSSSTQGMFALDFLLPEKYAARNSLRVEPKVEFKPIVVNQQIETQKSKQGDWDVTSLSLEVEQVPATKPAPASFQKSAQQLDSITWSDSGDICFMLTRDGVLHRIRVPEFREERKIKIKNGTGLHRSREGLIVESNFRQEILLFDEETLELKQRFPLAQKTLLSATPQSSLLWYARIDKIRGIPKAFSVHAFDLTTGKETISFTDKDLSQWLQSPDINIKRLERSVKDIRQLNVSPDGRHLFLSHKKGVYRFAIKKQSVSFEDALPNLNIQNSLLPYFIFSQDARFIIISGVVIPSRPTYPMNSTRSIAGCYMFPIANFDHLETAVKTKEFSSIIGFNIQSKETYSTARKAAFQVFNADGTFNESVNIGPRPEYRPLYTHPKGKGLFLAGEEILWLSKSSP